MTAIGKMLVILVTVLTVMLMAASVASFTTATDWKKQLETVRKEQGEIQKTLAETDEKANAAKGRFDEISGLKADFEKKSADAVSNLTADTKNIQIEITKIREQIQTIRKTADGELNRVNELAKNVEDVKGDLSASTAQKTQFKDQNSLLLDLIWDIRRNIGVTRSHQANMTEAKTANRVAAFPRP